MRLMALIHNQHAPHQARRDQVQEWVKSYGVHWLAHPNLWYLGTNESAAEVRDAAMDYVNGGDTLVVLEVESVQSLNTSYGDEGVKWFRQILNSGLPQALAPVGPGRIQPTPTEIWRDDIRHNFDNQLSRLQQPPSAF